VLMLFFRSERHRDHLYEINPSKDFLASVILLLLFRQNIFLTSFIKEFIVPIEEN